MTFNEIITAISTVGFPCVMCGALFWYMIKQNESNQENIQKLTETVNNNTVALTQLTERLRDEYGSNDG